MSNYAIITDAASALTRELVAEWDIKVLPMTAYIGSREFKHDPYETEMTMTDFYVELKAGATSGTAAVNPGEWADSIEVELKKEKDVIAIAFSSALSSTYENCCMGAEDLREKYPERKIFVIDSKCADFGQAMYVWYGAKKRSQGASIEETVEYLEAIKLNICHWFTVDDLHHLRRGGRVSATTAVVGSALGIKPVLHVDDEGRLINVSKARGRKNSLLALTSMVGETAIEPETQTMFLSHANCLEDAQIVAEELKNKYKVPEVLITQTAPIAGAHSGPGTVALFFFGSKR